MQVDCVKVGNKEWRTGKEEKGKMEEGDDGERNTLEAQALQQNRQGRAKEGKKRQWHWVLDTGRRPPSAMVQ